MHFVIVGIIHSLLLFAVVLIVKHWTRETVAFKWLALVLLFSFACDAGSIANYVFRLGIEQNLLSNLHTMFNPFLVGIFFFHLLKGRRLMYFLIVFLLANFAFSVSLPLSTQAYSSFNTLTEGFLILVLSLLWYFKILKDPPAQNIQLVPEFWVVTGFFLPTSGKLIVYTVSTYLMTVLHDNLTILQTIHNFLSVIGNLFIAYGMFIQHRDFQRYEDARSPG